MEEGEHFEDFVAINPKIDTFLGETSVQIKGYDGYPSVHLVRSYLIKVDAYTTYFYHIFAWRCGTTVINYKPWHYQQVADFIDVSDFWDIFYVDVENTEPIPVNKDWRYK